MYQDCRVASQDIAIGEKELIKELAEKHHSRRLITIQETDPDTPYGALLSALDERPILQDHVLHRTQ